MQRFNSIRLHDGFIDDDRPEEGALQINQYFFGNFWATMSFRLVDNNNNVTIYMLP